MNKAEEERGGEEEKREKQDREGEDGPANVLRARSFSSLTIWSWQ